MWVFSILFLVCALVLIVGVIMLIPKRTRQKGKIIAISFLILSVIFYGISRFSSNNYPNDEPGTITKSQYRQLKEGMTKDEVIKLLGDPASEDADVHEWDYRGIDGVSSGATAMLFFDGDTLSSIVDDGIITKSATSASDSGTSSTDEDTQITKKQYDQIKIGMSNTEVQSKLGKVSKENISDLDNQYEWNYSTDNGGLAYFKFDRKSNKLVEKSEIGVLSSDSSTITDKNGTRNNKSSETAKEDNSDYQNEVDSTIESVIDKDFTFDTTLKKLELNKNEGTNNPNDYVALIYLSYNETHSEKTTKKWIDKYTSHLAAKLAEKEPDITSISIFWETPRFKKNWNTAKFNLTKKDNKFYFDSENYDKTVFK